MQKGTELTYSPELRGLMCSLAQLQWRQWGLATFWIRLVATWHPKVLIVLPVSKKQSSLKFSIDSLSLNKSHTVYFVLHFKTILFACKMHQSSPEGQSLWPGRSLRLCLWSRFSELIISLDLSKLTWTWSLWKCKESDGKMNTVTCRLATMSQLPREGKMLHPDHHKWATITAIIFV